MNIPQPFIAAEVGGMRIEAGPDHLLIRDAAPQFPASGSGSPTAGGDPAHAQGDGAAGPPSSPHMRVFARAAAATIRAWGIEAEVVALLNQPEEGPRLVGDILPGVLDDMQKRPCLARAVDGGVDVLDPALPHFSYEVDDAQLLDARGAWELVRQLSEKRWVGVPTFEDLARAALQRLDVAATHKASTACGGIQALPVHDAVICSNCNRRVATAYFDAHAARCAQREPT